LFLPTAVGCRGQKLFLTVRKEAFVGSLQFVRGVLAALNAGGLFEAAVPLAYAAFFPTVFDGRHDQDLVAAGGTRSYAPLVSLRAFSTARCATGCLGCAESADRSRTHCGLQPTGAGGSVG